MLGSIQKHSGEHGERQFLFGGGESSLFCNQETYHVKELIVSCINCFNCGNRIFQNEVMANLIETACPVCQIQFAITSVWKVQFQ